VDGELAPGGIVTFHPVDGGPVAIGNIHDNGTYSLRTGQGNLEETDGGTVRSGEYIVTVAVRLPVADEEESEAELEFQQADSEEAFSPEARRAAGGPPPTGPQIAAAKYRSKETSDLKRTVEPGLNVFVLNLERATPAEETAAEVSDEEQPVEEGAAEPNGEAAENAADADSTQQTTQQSAENAADPAAESSTNTEEAQ